MKWKRAMLESRLELEEHFSYHVLFDVYIESNLLEQDCSYFEDE